MRRSEYAKTRRAQLKKLAERRYRRLFLQVQQSPQSKNIRAADAIAFQQALVTELESKQQLAYRGNVVLQFEFYNKSRTPPAIYKLPKNYLDLMEAPRADSGITRQHLLFRNDRQVKGLIVRYHVDGMFDEPQVVLHTEPFRDFSADAELIDRISRNDFADDGEWPCRSRRDAPFRSETAVLDESEKLAEFESEAESYRRSLGDDAFEAMRFMMRQSAQQEFLLSQDRFVCSSLLTLFRYYAKTRKLPSDDPRAQILAASRNSMISPHLMLELLRDVMVIPKDSRWSWKQLSGSSRKRTRSFFRWRRR